MSNYFVWKCLVAEECHAEIRSWVEYFGTIAVLVCWIFIKPVISQLSYVAVSPCM